MMTSPKSPTPRWLTPAERPDMWERCMEEYREWARNQPPKVPVRLPTEWEREERECRAICEALKEVKAEMIFEHTAPAAWAREFEPGKYPRLRVTGGKRAGRVGEARFKGRYHPHLIVDNAIVGRAS